ncbi:MAG: flavodoxin family protein [Methanobrevibacter sp.]|nr:flavodoxin family protein [Methanobrevibacter sp.]
MKILAIQASPRKHGNCDILMDEMIAGALSNGHDIEKIYLDDLDISPCQACLYCQKHGECKIDDDESDLIEKLLVVDGLIFATPIYYGHMTAQAKLFVDRTYQIAFNPDKNFSGKVALIFTHADGEGKYSPYIEYTKYAPFEVMGFEELDTVVVGSVFGKGQVKSQPNKLKKAQEIGEKF